MANPIEKDEDRSIENTKGAFDNHECYGEKTILFWSYTAGDTCYFFEDCINETSCELTWWASMIKIILIVVAVIIVLLAVIYCGLPEETANKIIGGLTDL